MSRFVLTLRSAGRLYSKKVRVNIPQTFRRFRIHFTLERKIVRKPQLCHQVSKARDEGVRRMEFIYYEYDRFI